MWKFVHVCAHVHTDTFMQNFIYHSRFPTEEKNELDSRDLINPCTNFKPRRKGRNDRLQWNKFKIQLQVTLKLATSALQEANKITGHILQAVLHYKIILTTELEGDATKGTTSH